jgi:hypothetical protein
MLVSEDRFTVRLLGLRAGLEVLWGEVLVFDLEPNLGKEEVEEVELRLKMGLGDGGSV